MKLLDFLDKERIIPSLHSAGKEGILAELTEPLVATQKIRNSREAVNVLLERERLGSTGIGDTLVTHVARSRDQRVSGATKGCDWIEGMVRQRASKT